METGTKVLKVTMPTIRHNEFVEDARLNFGDCRWLKILHDGVMSKNAERIIKLILEGRDEDFRFMVQQLKLEMVEELRRLYKLNN